MKNDTRDRISNWYASRPVRCTVLLCFITNTVIVPATALADVGLPPPAVHQATENGFPSSRALKQQGYNPQTGVLRVDSTNNGRPTVSSNGSTITGSQNKTVTMTGKYGEKATTTTTQTQRINSNRLEVAMGGVLASATAAGGAIGSDFAANAYKDFQAGDYKNAARNAVGAVLEGLSKLDITGAGAGINQFLQKTGLSESGTSGTQAEQLGQAAQKAQAAQKTAEANGDFAGAAANAAVAKAAQAASQAAQQSAQTNAELKKQEESGKNIVLVRYAEFGPGFEHIEWKSYTTSQSVGRSDYGNFHLKEFPNSTFTFKLKDDLTLSYQLKNPGKYGYYLGIGEYPDTLLNRKNLNQTSVKPQDMILGEQDIKDILNRMLQNQQTNHEELMKQLSKMGDAVEKATESNEFKEVTATSAPYTPAGSDTPQQTQFKVNKDGTVSTTTVSRPDLQPHSSQAPTRSAIIPKKTGESTTPNETGTPTGEQTTPTGEHTGTSTTVLNQNQEQSLLCKAFPNIAACAELGNIDYEDVSIPEKPIDLNFEPIDAFSNTGTCPPNKSVDFGVLGTFEVSYEMPCYVASVLRPILILIVMLGCGTFAYAAVREL